MSSTNDPTLPRPPEEGEDTLADVLGGFPRHLTTQLLDEEVERGRGRRRLATWALTCALGLFALALPQPRLFLEGALAGSPAGPAPGWSADLVGGPLGGWLGMHLAHQAALVASALALALCLPVSLSIAARSGAPWGQQLAMGMIVVLAPAAWLGGTGDRIGAGFLLAQLLLFRAVWNGGPGARRGALVLWALGALAWPVLLWQLPAVLMGTAEPAEPVRLRWRRALLAGATALVPVALGHAAALLGGSDLLGRLLLDGPPGEPLVWTAPLAWVGTSLAGLGLATLGLAALVLVRREESEEAPPLWLLAWCAVPLVAACLGPLGPMELTPLVFLPVALLGALDLVARQDPAPGSWLAGGLGVGQAALLLGALGALDADDPDRAWRERARQELEPDDLVISDSEAHRAELLRRWNLEVVAPAEASTAALEAADSGGRRVVLDLQPGAIPSLPAGLQPVWLGGPVPGDQ